MNESTNNESTATNGQIAKEIAIMTAATVAVTAATVATVYGIIAAFDALEYRVNRRRASRELNPKTSKH